MKLSCRFICIYFSYNSCVHCMPLKVKGNNGLCVCMRVFNKALRK